MIAFTYFAVIRPFSYEIFGVGETEDEARNYAALYGGAVIDKDGVIRYGYEDLAVVPCTEALVRSYRSFTRLGGVIAEMHNIVGLQFRKVREGICLPEEVEAP